MGGRVDGGEAPGAACDVDSTRKEAHMHTRGTRRLREGREVDIGRNEGLRKVCHCGRNKWSKCPHTWHFSFQWQGTHHRFSLERHVGRKLTRTEAEAEAERLRTAIRAGEFRDTTEPVRQPK